MRRNWQSVRGEGGDNEAMQYATALAQIADGELIESIVHAVSALNRFGGEVRIAAYRGKFDAAGRKVGRDEVGSYETTGYLYDYNHHAKVGPTEGNYNPDNPPELNDPTEVMEEPVTGPDPLGEGSCQTGTVDGVICARGGIGCPIDHEPALEEQPVG